jgi:hypothetical protein
VPETNKDDSLLNFDLKEKIWGATSFVLVIAAKLVFRWLHWIPKVPDPLQELVTPNQFTNAIAASPLVLFAIPIFSFKAWRNRRRHVEGKAAPGKVVIFVGELEGDGKKGQHRTNIIRSLTKALGTSAQILQAPFELRPGESGDASDDAGLASRKAREYLEKTGGDLLVWGQVLDGSPPVIDGIDHMFVQSYDVPTIRAQLALNHNDPSRAIEILQAAVPYELSDSGPLYPVYVRGEAYLAAHKGSEAAAEFQKIDDHRGIVVNAPIGALAQLGLGRAYALSGDKTKAKSAYQDFLTIWKDADPDIPMLKQAKAEYAKLQ